MTARARVLTSWVSESDAENLRRRASETGSSVSAVVTDLLESSDLDYLGPPTAPRKATLGIYAERPLIERVDHAARSAGITRSELIASAIAEALT